MAKEAKSQESLLWDMCDKLRGGVESSEYKHVILSLIFLKYANDRFTVQREKLISEGTPPFLLEDESAYGKDNVFFVYSILFSSVSCVYYTLSGG